VNRNYEIYLLTEIRVDPNRTEGIPMALEINYGLLPNVQFSFSVSTVYAQTGDRIESGVGDEAIGLKYRFVQETNARARKCRSILL